MAENIINIAEEFTRHPGPRNVEDGPKSGEEFRERILVPRLSDAEKSGSKVIVVLDGARGYTASFLEEAFGGLVRLSGFSRERLSVLLEVRVADPRIAYWKGLIDQFITEARAA